MILNTYDAAENALHTMPIYNYLKTDSYCIKTFGKSLTLLLERHAACILVMNGSIDGSVSNDYTSSNLYGATVVAKVTTISEDIKPVKGRGDTRARTS